MPQNNQRRFIFVRADFLVLPARLVSGAGHNVILQLPRGYRHQAEFVAAFKKAGKLRLPQKT